MKKFESQVYSYLIYLQYYLNGDLEKFEKLCEEAEKLETRISRENAKNKEFLQTTMSPDSFEFIHGKSNISRSTIPHTLTLFATIDILGFLTREGKDYRSTINNFNSFFSGLKQKIDCLEVTVLRNIYRHGLAHNYFPKLNTEIAFRFNYSDNELFLKNNNNLILNVKCLIKIVKMRLQEIINDSDEMLLSRLEKQFQILVEVYEKECRKDIETLISRL